MKPQIIEAPCRPSRSLFTRSAFPLTLILSPREREQPPARCRNSNGIRNVFTRRILLPLPKGEGRSEGEPCVRHHWTISLFHVAFTGLLFGLLVTTAAAADQNPALANVAKIVAAAADYESGKTTVPLREVEALVRQSAGNKALRKQLETELARLLAGNATFEAKRFACAQLAVVGSDAILPDIAELLKKDETAGIACLALSATPSAKANTTLRNALSEARGLARVHILNTLGDRRDPNAVKPLSKLARDVDSAAAQAAIISLGKIGTVPAAAALAPLRKDANSATVRTAVEASLYAADQLASAGQRKPATAIYEELLQPSQAGNVRRAAFEGLMRLDKDGGEQRILETLRGTDRTLKPSAIAAIRSLKSKEASAKFAQELPGLPPAEQVLLLDALAWRGDTDALAALRSNLSAADTAVRQAAIAGLGRQGDATAVPALVQALAAAQSAPERQATEQALIGLAGGKATDTALVAELRQASAETKVRLMPVLPRRGLHDAVPVLLDLTGNATTARPAFQTLARLATAEDLPLLLDRLVNLKVSEARTEAETAVAQVISKSGDVPRRSALVCSALAKAKDVDTRVSLIGLLPTCGGVPALDALKAAGADQEPRVSDAAIRTLADWPDAVAWNPLMRVYRQTSTESHRVLALRGLVRLAGDANAKPDGSLIERYRQLLDSAKTDDDRKMILGALAGVAHPDALKLALPLLENPALEAEAKSAVKKIAESIKGKHPQAAEDALRKVM